MAVKKLLNDARLASSGFRVSITPSNRNKNTILDYYHGISTITMSFISGVHRCVVHVFTGSEDPRCSCSGSTRGNTLLELLPPTPEPSSSSSPVDRSHPLHRESLRPSGDAGISPPPYVVVLVNPTIPCVLHIQL